VLVIIPLAEKNGAAKTKNYKKGMIRTSDWRKKRKGGGKADRNDKTSLQSHAACTPPLIQKDKHGWIGVGDQEQEYN
jgi:hypothetical protein